MLLRAPINPYIPVIFRRQLGPPDLNQSTCRIDHRFLYWRSPSGAYFPLDFSTRTTEAGRESGPGALAALGGHGTPARLSTRRRPYTKQQPIIQAYREACPTCLSYLVA